MLSRNLSGCTPHEQPPGLDTMQVCEKGHLINDSVNLLPQFNKKFCPKCGAVTTTTCKKCGKKIPGCMLGSTLVKKNPPVCCDGCGEPYPWSVQKGNTQGASAMSLFSPGDKVHLKSGGPEMVVDFIDSISGVVCSYWNPKKHQKEQMGCEESSLEKLDPPDNRGRYAGPSKVDDSTHDYGRYVGPAKEAPSKKVFIVHGHDDAMKQEVARVLSDLGLEPIILHEQPNQGRTTIEKFEKNADVGFAVVLLSGDDMAYPVSSDRKKTKPRPRARQNVVMELGYFLAKLGRDHVLPLYKVVEGFELPSDFQGVVYTPFDAGWPGKLVQELHAAKYDVDANKLFKK